jgi:purine-nucleoside phosphorylase
MPGDPLRAKFVAEKYLENPVEYNSVRGMLGYTGTYKGKRISVQGSGMGIPSMGIYSYELIHFYGCKNLIRIGSAGSLQKDIDLYDIVIGMGACTDSGFATQYNLPGTYSAICSYELLSKAVAAANAKNIDVKVGNLLSADVFYSLDGKFDNWARMGVMAVEMEAAGLYMNAAYGGANALCIATISDSIVTGEATSSDERQTAFTKMMEIALEIA